MIQKNHLSSSVLLAASLFPVSSTFADVAVSNVFGNHMVLQQGSPIRIWGTGDSGEGVTVSLGGKSAERTTSKDGTWRVDLPAFSADGKAPPSSAMLPRSQRPRRAAYTMTVRGKNTIGINLYNKEGLPVSPLTTD